MPVKSESSRPPSSHAARHPWRRRVRLVLLLLASWGVAAYLVAPWLWEMYFRHHSQFTDTQRITETADGHPGDPLNIALVGDESQVVLAMSAAGWYPADPITFRSSVRIAVDSVIREPDDNAPVSNLYLFGRKQDLAFEQPIGDSPRQRHHVRFWRWDKLEGDRPVWFGSATFDERVGLSYTTGQVTHHIGSDVDAERDRIVSELQKADWSQQVSWDDGFHGQREGRNGGGDRWRTDGRLAVVVLRQEPVAAPIPTKGIVDP